MNDNVYDDKFCKQVDELLSGYVDGELSQQQSQFVALHLATCSTCQQTLTSIEELKMTIKQVSYPAMEQQQLNAVLQDLSSQRMQQFSWFALISGILICIIFAVYQFFIDSTTPWYFKLSISLIWGGIIGLFLSVLRQRLLIRKTDKYNKVEL
jgi:anti-sigma factor RsiW